MPGPCPQREDQDEQEGWGLGGLHGGVMLRPPALDLCHTQTEHS